jgi:hypothetical protein
MPFSAQELDLLAETEEIRIETTRSDGTTRTTIIWVMTDGDDVFVRSVKGDRGYWYQRAVERPTVALIVGRQRIAATAVPAHDEDSIARCSAAIQRKYAGIPGEKPMLAPRALPTTMRLEPA